MARDILSEYGRDHRVSAQSPGRSGLSTDGGKPYLKPAPYARPVGPINNMVEGPRAGDVEPDHGTSGEELHEPGEREFTGSPGLHGTNHGNGGSQGSY